MRTPRRNRCSPEDSCYKPLPLPTTQEPTGEVPASPDGQSPLPGPKADPSVPVQLQSPSDGGQQNSGSRDTTSETLEPMTLSAYVARVAIR